MIFGLEFPPVSHAIEWPTGPLGINKVIVLMWLSVLIVFGLLWLAGRSGDLVPRGVKNIAEATIDFIREGIIMQTMGSDGLGWTPLLLTLFTFIFMNNVWGIIPVAQMPVNARMALPMFMALLIWVLFVLVGIKNQGPIGYFKNIMFPPGVPKALYVLVTPIELVSTILVRPLSHSVRLFANALAGHLILISFAVITAAVWAVNATIVILPFSFGLLVALTGFELLVAFLQAYIFTILAAVYIGSSMHPEH
ncbi:MAG: F0F1 ATP synthase subunit A [Acidimicrobiales bacterium]